MARPKRTLALAASLAAAIGIAFGGVAHAAPSARVAPDCRAGYYENVSGHCVHRPVHASKAPAGATAKCRDGSYSFSQHASGTWSGHGGVAVWIHHP